MRGEKTFPVERLIERGAKAVEQYGGEGDDADGD